VYGYMAPRMVTTFKYSDTIGLSIPTGVIGTYVFRMNSIFAPDKTAGGGANPHQPYGHDQLATIYNRYRVYRFEYEIRIPNTTGDLIIAVTPFNGVSPAATTIAGFDTACEYPKTIVKSIAAGANEIVIRKSVFLRAITGVPAVEYNTDDRFAALMSASPTEVFELCLTYYNPTAATVAPFIKVKFVYHCDLFDIFSQTESFRHRVEGVEKIEEELFKTQEADVGGARNDMKKFRREVREGPLEKKKFPEIDKKLTNIEVGEKLHEWDHKRGVPDAKLHEVIHKMGEKDFRLQPVAVESDESVLDGMYDELRLQETREDMVNYSIYISEVRDMARESGISLFEAKKVMDMAL